MRVIEKKIIDTIKSFEENCEASDYTIKRLTCRDVVNVVNAKVRVNLWENPIFAMDLLAKPIVWFSFCGWTSNTTKSRLNALLSAFSMGGFFQKDWEIYYSSSNQKAVKIDTSKVYKVFNGHATEVAGFWQLY